MKKNLLTIAAILIIAITFGETAYAQFGDLINKAKDAAKKKEKKAETKKEDSKKEEAKSDDSSNQNSAKVEQDEIGKIYFSNQPFPEGGSVPNAKNSFNSNEFIYGRIVFKSSTLRDNMKIFSKQEATEIDEKDPPTYSSSRLANRVPFMFYRLLLSKDGVAIFDTRGDQVKLLEGEPNQTYWDFDVLPAPEKAKTTWLGYNTPQHASIYTWIKPEYFKSEGEYKIYAVVYNKTKDAWGKLEKNEDKWIGESGEVAFNFRMSDISMLQANGKKAAEFFENNSKKAAMENQEVPPQWTDKSSPIIGGYTTASISNLYRNSFSTPAANLKIIKLFAKAPAVQGMWTIQYNDIGIPTYRYSSQWFTAFVQDTNSGGCFYQGFGLRQNYSGAGTYGGVFADSEKIIAIKCDKLGVK